MRRLKSIKNLAETKPPSKGPRMRILMANVAAALDKHHIRPETAKQLFSELMTIVEGKILATPGMSISEFPVDDVYVEAVAILTRLFATAAYQRRAGGAAVGSDTDEMISYQPSWAFKFWLDDKKVPPAGYLDHKPMHVRQCIKAFHEPTKRLSGAKIGGSHSAMWLTPLRGHVEKEVSSVRGCTPDEIAASSTATRLRELLGLSDRKSGEHAIALITVPFATLCSNPATRLTGPTVFDSQGYYGFRHWPPPALPNENVGRTFDLTSDAKRRGAGYHQGASELVRQPIALDEVREIVYLGVIRPSACMTEADIAEEVAGGVSTEALIDQVADILDAIP